MKLFVKVNLFLLLVCAFSCSKNNESFTYDVEPSLLVKDFKNWWNYTYSNINLSSGYKQFDTNDAVISQKAFLKKLKSGNFIPVKIVTKDTVDSYKLYALKETDNPDIKQTIKQMAATELDYLNKKGTPFPDFDFTDIDGNKINKESTKGKYLVVKCWYIHCRACVAEIPKLNVMVQKYSSRNDIVFVSLATDTQDALKKFLDKKDFKYMVVPDQEKYMTDILGLTIYPTHFIINKAGKIVGIFNAQKELETALNTILNTNAQ